jgi:hypothetical protein
MPLRWLVVALPFLVLYGPTASAQERFPLYVRGGLGAGMTTVSVESGFESPSSHGPGLLWDAAAGGFVTHWLVLHASAFGSVSPRAKPSASCRDNCGPERREALWAQTYGAGLTLTPSRSLGRSRLRPYCSSSAGLAVIGAPVVRVGIGAGVQFAFGLEYELREQLRIGLGIQGMFEGRRPLQIATHDGFRYWQGGGLLSLSYDRPRTRR